MRAANASAIVFAIFNFLIPLGIYVSSSTDYIDIKWAWLYGYSIIGGILFLILNEKQEIKPPLIKNQFFLFSAAVTVIGFIPSVILNFNTLDIVFGLRLLTFINLIFIYFQIFETTNWHRFFTWSILLAGIIDIAMTVTGRYFVGTKMFQDGFFGNPNLHAEFLGLVCLLCIFSIYRTKGIFKNIFFLSISLISSVIALSDFARGAILAVLVGASSFLFLSKLKQFTISKYIKIIGFAGIVLSVLIIGFFTFATSSDLLTDEFINSKNETASLRIIRWKNTIAMIKDNPLGKGFQSFAFAYLPYKNSLELDWEISQEKISFSPHNSFMDLSAEYGILTAIGIFLILGFVVVQGFLRFKHNKPEYFQESLSIITYFLTLSAFSFPFELAWSWNVFLLFTLYILYKECSFNGLTSIAYLNWVYKISVCAVSLSTLGFIMMKFNFPFKDLNNSATMCRLFKSDWNRCLKLSETLISEGKVNEASALILNELYRQPHNFIAMNLFGNIYKETGLKKEYCHYLYLNISNVDSTFLNEVNCENK